MINKAEIVIVGGGISGCAIAYNLAKQGMRDIVVIEKGYISSGATGRCGAGVRQQWGTEMNCRLAKASIEYFENMQEELQYNHDIEFKQGGYLLLASTEKEHNQFTKNVALQNSLGINSRQISREEAKEIVPHLNTEMFLSAAFCQKDGHLNPFHANMAYAKAAERLGVKIYTFTEVLDIKVDNGKIKGVETSKGFIHTTKVVNAAGGYCKAIGDMVGVDMPVYSERHQILVTEPIEQIQGPMVMSFSLNIYCQQTPHGSFIMGHGDPDEAKDLRITSSWQFLDHMAKTCVDVLPKLGDLRVVRQWAGLYNITPDRQPIYSTAKEVEGYFIAVGFSGHGFMLAPMTGVLMAEMILNKPFSIDVSALNLERFAKGELVLEPSVV